MKKQFLNIVGAIAIGSLLLVSCSETTEAVEGANENVEHHEKEAGEDGKTYEEPGSCPVCNMDLVEMEHAH